MTYDPSDPTARESALQPSEQRRLEEANHLLENNKPAQAAPIFAKLAEVLESANQPKRAASLHASAARAFAKSRNESAVVQSRTAINLFLQYQMDKQAEILYNEISLEFKKRGMKDAADTLTKEFASRFTPQPSPTQTSTAHFPSNCPNCGAPLGSKDIHWTDPNSAECGFCGTPIRPSAP